jgi:preprotein translocase subunit SecG
MQTTILIVHTLIALGIIILVLLQRGKGAEAGAAFGAGASGTVFGSRGSTSFFSRTTAILATAFFATSLTLAYISSQRAGAPESLLEDVPIEESAPREAMPEMGPTEDAVPELPDTPVAAPGPADIEAPRLDADTAAEEAAPDRSLDTDDQEN